MLIATHSNVYALNDNAPQNAPDLVYEGSDIERVSEGNRYTVIVLKGGDLVLQSGDTTQTVATGIGDPIESLLILNENPLHLLVGTEGPHLYRVEGGKVERVESFEQLDCRENWYTPWGGPAALRCLDRTADGWVYADIHVGSIMRSPDGGASWEPVTPDLHDDVHQVATSPQINGRVYANTAHAVYISDDRGASWQHRSEGFPYRYGRAIAVHPQDSDCILATVSKGPHDDAQGRLYRSEDAGQTWEHVTHGFPESAPGNIDTFHVAFSQNGEAWAILGQTLYRSTDKGCSWSEAWEAPENIEMIACK